MQYSSLQFDKLSFTSILNRMKLEFVKMSFLFDSISNSIHLLGDSNGFKGYLLFRFARFPLSSRACSFHVSFYEFALKLLGIFRMAASQRLAFYLHQLVWKSYALTLINVFNRCRGGWVGGV